MLLPHEMAHLTGTANTVKGFVLAKSEIPIWMISLCSETLRQKESQTLFLLVSQSIFTPLISDFCVSCHLTNGDPISAPSVACVLALAESRRKLFGFVVALVLFPGQRAAFGFARLMCK